MSSTRRSLSGTTLVEIMVAVALIGVIAISFVGVFAGISKGIQFSKARTLASVLAQEQMQLLKQKSFNKILLTTATPTMYIPDFPVDDDLKYDPGYYPPESIIEGSIPFTRYTYVQTADEDSGTLTYIPGAAVDTGMKSITVTVVWYQGDDAKKLQVRSIASNIETTMTNSIFYGAVTNSATSAGIGGATVMMAENVGYADTTNTSGNYSINLSPGAYTMYASARGYYPQYRMVSIAANQSLPQNFPLIAMGSGTVRGTAWINSHPVISQVVASTENMTGFCQEYVELFNPSTTTWTMATISSSAILNLAYARYGDTGPTIIALDYYKFTIDPGRYYLIANTPIVSAGGVSRRADATYSATNALYPDIIKADSGVCGGGGDADTVGLLWATTNNDIDVVGWNKTTTGHANPPGRETSPIVQSDGFTHNEQFVRRTSTNSTIGTGIGRAYDTDNNSVDFIVASPIQYPPRNSTDSEPIVSGRPAYGAYVSATDGLSETVTAQPVGSPPYAEFQLVSVATGTWTVIIASDSYSLEISSVIVTPSATTRIPNAVTTPTWAASGYYASNLNDDASEGYVSGTVKNALGVAISSAIPVSAAGASASANTTTGQYFLRLLPGTYDITANANNAVATYVTVTSQTVQVDLGRVSSDVDFILTQGGRIRGRVTRDGTNALPGVAVVALDANDVARDQEVSGSDGYFLMTNLATGTYSVEPVLGSGEASSPTSVTSTVTAGVTVFSSTFTISGAYGTIRGSVTESGSPVRSGIIVMASTTTITVPPALSLTTLEGAGYYATNSYEDGTYALEVLGSTSTTYKVYGYYTSFNGSTPVVSTRSVTNVSVVPGNTTSGVDLSW